MSGEEGPISNSPPTMGAWRELIGADTDMHTIPSMNRRGRERGRGRGKGRGRGIYRERARTRERERESGREKNRETEGGEQV